MKTAAIGLLLVLLCSLTLAESSAEGSTIRVRLTVGTPLTYQNTPLDPTIDFAELIRQSGGSGVLDPNSIEVRDGVTDEVVAHAVTEAFAYGDKGRIEFVVEDPGHTQFEIRFRAVKQRLQRKSQPYTPPIGVGDLLRFNAMQPRPIAIPYSAGLHDLNDDGQLDLTGTWNYAYRPGGPWDGITCYPRASQDQFEFGDLTRLRFRSKETPEPQFFSHTYMAADFADFDQDGRLDLVMTRSGTNSANFYRNTGKHDIGGMPVFEPAGSVNVAGWQAVRAVDLDDDGAMDLVVDGEYVHNDSVTGWPFEAAASVRLDAGRKPCFLDVDNDGHLDSICLKGSESVQPDFYRVAWRKNIGGTPPKFGDETLLQEFDLPEISLVSSWSQGNRSGLIVQHGAFQELSFYQLGNARFAMLGRAESVSAVMSLSDQAWPCLCDWDDDGDQDLLVGGGYGWPRIVINDAIIDRRAHWTESFRAVDWNGDGLHDLIYSVAGAHSGTKDGGSIYLLRNVGTATAPRFADPETMRCFGEPIRITNHGPHPWAGDFDGDGKPDLIACVEWSVYPYYSHAALMMKQRPEYKLELIK